MGGQGPPWRGEAGGQLPKNGADVPINKTPLGCVSFLERGFISALPSLANSPCTPAGPRWFQPGDKGRWLAQARLPLI